MKFWYKKLIRKINAIPPAQENLFLRYSLHHLHWGTLHRLRNPAWILRNLRSENSIFSISTLPQWLIILKKVINYQTANASGEFILCKGGTRQCGKAVGNDEVLLCSSCNTRFHYQCQGINKEKFTNIMKLWEDMTWYCIWHGTAYDMVHIM